MVAEPVDERRIAGAGASRGEALPRLIDTVQQAWAERPVAERLRVLRRWRQETATRTDALCDAIAAEPSRTRADVLVSEVLPLLAACEFLEKRAERVLAPRRLGWRGRPVWLARVSSAVERVALGRVLVIGPSNYPLFLPGVQVLQALAAGNRVTWKPGRGGRAVAELFAATMLQAGLPDGLLRVTGETDADGEAAVLAGADKVFFTGSGRAGRVVMHALAESATPCVMELSDSSAVVVLPSADVGRVAAAVAFGMRLNGSATCMAPRRLMAVSATAAMREDLVRRLTAEFAKVRPVRLAHEVRAELKALVDEAGTAGATVVGRVGGVDELGVEQDQAPVMILGARPEMRAAQTDIFAPLLCVMDVENTDALLEAQAVCPYGLCVSIFGEEEAARQLGTRMRVGTVIVNDVIVPTADPRVPFGGRRASGFGVTRGAEGLLEMTAVKTVLVQRGTSRNPYEPTGDTHAEMFGGAIVAGHGKTWAERLAGLRRMMRAGSTLGRKAAK